MKRLHTDRSAVFAAALIVAVGGLIYELILGTTASYLFGDSIVSFSVSAGLTLFGMGLGSLLAAKLTSKPGVNFVRNELILSMLGGNSVLVLFAAFSLTKFYWIVFIIMSLLIGIAIGAEIPLLMSLIKQRGTKDSIGLLSKVLAADYFGALVASLLFPFLLLPYLGLVRTAYAVALLNILVAWYMLTKLKLMRKVAKGTYTLAVLVSINLFGGLIYATRVENAINTALYQDPVVYYNFSPYQKLVVTKYKEDTRLYLNNQLQFSSIDEARYHETLAHAALTSAPAINKALILGGGDGLLAREVLKYPGVRHIDLVDIDPAVTGLGKENRLITDLNQNALNDPKVRVINTDAYTYIRETTDRYDVIFVDLVDPSNERIAKLYSKEFYQSLQRTLGPRGIFITQASSTYFTPRAFWQIHATIQAAMPQKELYPLMINIPSFGEWGFIMVTNGGELFTSRGLPETVYHSTDSLNQLLQLSPELTSARSATLEASTLLAPKIYRTYQRDMSQWTF